LRRGRLRRIAVGASSFEGRGRMLREFLNNALVGSGLL